MVGCYPDKIINLAIWLGEGINHPEHQKKIMANSKKYWNMELDEMIEEIGKEKPE